MGTAIPTSPKREPRVRESGRDGEIGRDAQYDLLTAALAATAPRPAHLAPRMTGATGRVPEGPRRKSSVAVAPIAAPMSAAVSRSY